MSLSIILAVAWVFASTTVALLPMRLQYLPGAALLLAAPLLIAFIGYQHGLLFALAGLIAFVSMFRNPLRYFWHKWTGCDASGGTR